MVSKDAQNEIVTAPVYHVPVLLKPTVDGLQIKPDGIYVDVTFGGGGHSREILSRLGPEGRLFSFDQDAEAMANVPADEPRLTFVQSNFRYLRHWLRYYEIDYVDGILADLGVSSHHFDDAARGFSFRFDAPLDMRMNKQAQLTAAEVINTYDEADLGRIFTLYGELKTVAGWLPCWCAAVRKLRCKRCPICSTWCGRSWGLPAKRKTWPRYSRPCASR